MKKLLLIFAVLLGLPGFVDSAATKEKYTIAVAEIMQETNSFSPVLTTRDDFKAGALLYGDEILPVARDIHLEIGGFLEAVDELGNNEINVVPIIKARSMSGGPVKRLLYEEFKRELVRGLKKTGQVDGVYLALHGAMGVEGLRDPEGDLIKAARSVVGESTPIGVSHDLHANLTRERIRLATFIVGYKTNPHRDHAEVGYRVGEILMKTIRGQVKPVMAFNKMKLLKGGGMTIDLLSPMRAIFSRMDDMIEDSDKVLDVSNFMVHLWLDDPELGWSTIAVTDNDPTLAQNLADELADLNWSVRSIQPPEGNTAAEAIAIAKDKWLRRKLGTVVFCDVADAVGAGAPGENTWILKSLLEEGAELNSYLTIRDKEAANTAWKYNVGDQVSLSVGGKLDRVYNRPLDFTGELIRKSEERSGKTVILKHRGIHLILTELSDSLYDPGYFSNLGLSLWKADIVVVKNLFPFRYRYLLYNRKTVNVITPGMTGIDVSKLKYLKISRPLYPLDDVPTWR
ncbi:MAG: M81 family metallopeptidase [Deltaproteobacteria bacterium]|nr:M81 family metallopeptidase [Deltaproteobacteria bacterium]